MTGAPMSPEAFGVAAAKVEAELRKLIVGQDEVVRDTIVALLAGGHVLLEGVPGLGKTSLVRALGDALELTFSRIQFTPDLMPADITGTTLIQEDEGGRRFHFQPGPVFANLVLADEVNRATPKVQSALLEAMQERTVTTGGATRPLPTPFFVLATQNPIELEGTYPLPEAQLDRFLFKLSVPYPSDAELAEIARRTTGTGEPRLVRGRRRVPGPGHVGPGEDGPAGGPCAGLRSQIGQRHPTRPQPVARGGGPGSVRGQPTCCPGAGADR